MDLPFVLCVLCAIGAVWLIGVTLLLALTESVTIKQALVWPFYPVVFVVAALVIIVSGCGVDFGDAGRAMPDAGALHSCAYYGCDEQPIDRACVERGECTCSTGGPKDSTAPRASCSPGPILCAEIGCLCTATVTCSCENPNGDGSLLVCRP